MRTEDGYIIYRCLNGDSTAFGFLVDKYKAGVYAFAYERLHNFHDAEDIAQEVFLKAYKSLRNLRRWDSFASWLYRIALNLCRNWIRSQSSRPDHGFIEDQDPELLENHSKDLYRQELACESVREALDSLPEMYSQVLNLHYLGGMTSIEIARFVGVSSAAVRKRLSKARSLLKEEILAMMSTTYEEQRLQSKFTFRIVEAVKRMKIQPAPRTGGLPWGLSLATGIVFAVLSFIPQPGIFNSVATGSPLPGETKVLKTGEIPVDILAVSEIPVIANKQGDGDGGEPGSSDPRNATLAAAHDEENIWTQEDKEVITDPKTGVKYTKIKTLVGKSDVIEYATAGLDLSPNGKFLIWHKLVVPLDGGEPFDRDDIPALRDAWSPDGKKVIFCSEGAIWLTPVSPETGQATGPAKKLVDGVHSFRTARWSPDSERVAFIRRDKEPDGQIWTLSVRDGTLVQITDDLAWKGYLVWSPDGKTVAYLRVEEKAYEIRLIPAEGGTSKKIWDYFGHPVSWSPDSKWLICKNKYNNYRPGTEFRFFRLADGRELDITVPKKVGWFFSCSPDGKKMLFYRPSYDRGSTLKVVSASGGPSWQLGRGLRLAAIYQFWSPNSRMIIPNGFSKDGDWAFWIIPLGGGDPFLLELDVSVPGKPQPWFLSPDGRKLLFTVRQSDGTEDLWAVPVSLKDGRTTGPAVIVFSGWNPGGSYYQKCSWSPDGTKIAAVHKSDIWIASAEGGEPAQITKNPVNEFGLVWSPGGEMIAYREKGYGEKGVLKVISASGGEATEILDGVHNLCYAWSPDSKELAAVSEEGKRISAISVVSGKSRQILEVEDKDLVVSGQAWGWALRWSPDGRNLAFLGLRKSEWSWHIFMIPAEGGEVTKLAVDDPGEKIHLYWSPDGKWISYGSSGFVKTRPEGEIWEADVSELLSSQQREQ